MSRPRTVLATALAACAAALAAAAHAQPSDTFSVVSPYVVTVVARLRGDVSYGTGVVLAGGTVITAAHVVDGASSVAIGRQGPVSPATMRPARIATLHRDSDIAVLSAQIPPDGLRTVEYPASSGDELWAFGYEYHSSGQRVTAVLRMSRASVGQRWRDYFQVDGAFLNGFSGGPLVTRGGKVAGILSFSARGNTSLAYMVPAHEIDRVVQPQAQPAPAAQPAPGTRTPAPTNHTILPGISIGPVFLRTPIEHAIQAMGPCSHVESIQGTPLTTLCIWMLPHPDIDGKPGVLWAAYGPSRVIAVAYTDATVFATPGGNRVGNHIFSWIREMGRLCERESPGVTSRANTRCSWDRSGIEVEYQPNGTVIDVTVY